MFLSLFSNVVECMRKYSNNIRIQKLRTHNIPSNSSLLFHPNSNQHYLFPHLLFHVLNSSQWLGIFLSKLVSFSPKFIYYSLNLIILCIVLSQIHILWIGDSMTVWYVNYMKDVIENLVINEKLWHRTLTAHAKCVWWGLYIYIYIYIYYGQC